MRIPSFFLQVFLISIIFSLTSSSQLKSLPDISLPSNETYRIHLSEYFSGYNLSYTLENTQPLPFAKITQSFDQIAHGSSAPKTDFSFSKYLIDKNVDGSWKGPILALSSNIAQNTANLYSGTISKDGTPNFDANIETIPYGCYDLAKLNSEWIVLDCRDQTSGIDAFYLLNVNDYKINSTIQNNFVIPPPVVKPNRNLRVYKSNANQIYLLRSLFEFDSGFIEIFIFNNNTLTKIASPLDKYTFGADSLLIKDMVVYGNDVFLINNALSVIRFNFIKEDKINYKAYPTNDQMNKLQVYSSPAQGLQVLLGNLHNLFILDWNDFSNPFQIEKYETTFSSMTNVNFCEDVVIVQGVLKTNDVEVGDQYLININKRGNYLESETYIVLDYSDAHNTIFDYNSAIDRLITMNGTLFKVFQLQDSFLTLDLTNQNSSKTPIIVNISYTDSRVGVKNYDLFNLVISDPNDMDVKPKDFPINNTQIFATYPGELKLDLNQYFSGPQLFYTVMFNIQYLNNDKKVIENILKFLNMKHLESKKFDLNAPNYYIEKANKFNISYNASEINFNNVIFSKTIADPRDNKYYFWFIQTNDFTTNVLYCNSFSAVNTQINCSSINNSTIALGHLVTRYSLARSGNNIWWGVLNNNHNVLFYDLANLSLVKNITTDSKDVFEEIVDFTVIDFNIYLLLQNKKAVRVVSLTSNNFGPSNIEINLQGQSFNVVYRVYYSVFHPNILFLKADGAIHILDITFVKSNYFSYVYGIIDDIISKSINYEISISDKSLVILTNTVIREYSISDLFSVYKRKDYYLYDYVINISSYDFSENSNLFAVWATKSSKTYCLVFDSGKLTNEVLYAAIKLNETQSLIIDIAGINKDILSIVSPIQGLLSYQLSSTPYLYIDSFFDPNSLNKSMITSFNITAYSLVSPSLPNYTINFTLTNWNTFINITEVAENKTILDRDNLLDYTADGEYQEFSFDPNALVNGSVLSYDLIPSKAEDSNVIKLAGPLKLNRTVSNMSSFHDIFILNEWTFVQRKNRLFIVDSSSFEINTIVDFPMPLTINCKKVVAHESGYFVASICQKKSGKHYLYMTSLISSQPFLSNIFDLDISSVSQLKLVGDYLYILDNEGSSKQSFLYIYRFNFEEAGHELFQQVSMIDNTILNSDKSFITSFDVVQSFTIGNTYYLILVDSEFGLRIIHIGAAQIINLYSIDLHSYIMKEGGNNGVKFAGVVLTNIQKTVNYSNFNLIISGKNFHSYEYYVSFNETNRTLIPNPSISVLRVFYRYSLYTALNNVFVVNSKNDQGFLLIPYMLESNVLANVSNFSPQLLIAYDLNKTNSSDYSLLYDNYILGSLKINTTKTDISFSARSYFNTTNNVTDFKVGLINPETHNFEELFLQRNLTIMFFNDNFTSGSIDIVASNDYFTKTFNFNIITHGGSSSNNYWIIGLVVGLIVVAILIVIAVKKFGKKKDKSEALLGNN